MTIIKNIDNYLVIGSPVKHSLSPKIHNKFAKISHHKINYNFLEIDQKNLKSFFQEFQENNNLKGLSITVPLKEEVFKLCDLYDDNAKESKAVSNIIFTKDRKIFGLNLDGDGLIYDLEKLKNISLKSKKILILGAGGAAKGIIPALIKKEPFKLAIMNRTKSKALEIAKNYKNIDVLNYNDVNEKFDIVINSTSASINNIMLPISQNIFNKNAISYDLMYKDGGTIFNKWSLENNIKTYDGLGMLLSLSKIIFEKWRGINLNIDLNKFSI